MTHTFALRSSDNALVWLKNPPVKPAFKESIYGQGTYQVLLTQAIADGVKVADEDKIENMIIDSGNWERDFVKVFVNPNHWKLRMKPDTPYALDVEVEIRYEYRFLDSQNWIECPKMVYGNDLECRKVAYLVEPKTENDMKEKCEHQYSRSMNQDYPRKCVKCGKPEPKEEPKQDGETLMMHKENDQTKKRIENELKAILPMCWDDKLGFDDVGRRVIDWVIGERWHLSEALRLCQEANRRAYTTIDEWEKAIDKNIPPAEPKEEQKELTDGEIIKWFRSQKFQTERGEQEYTMIFEIDLPKIIRAFIHRK